MGCMDPQPFEARGNRSYLKFWAVTSDPRYPRYLTLIVALEPFVEQVVGAGHSTVGRTGTHMLLQALSCDSTIQSWG
jgi:hypothetical protein